uniref:Uncharacterized protein n=1 Tax=Knipowitschia caucasica TaxID=637954 RepID=A0AAV2LS85_KNICA
MLLNAPHIVPLLMHMELSLATAGADSGPMGRGLSGQQRQDQQQLNIAHPEQSDENAVQIYLESPSLVSDCVEGVQRLFSNSLKMREKSNKGKMPPRKCNI